MNFGDIIFPLPTEERKIIRRIEKTIYKINSAKTAIIFNESCLKEGLLPKYSILRLHDPTASRDINTRNFRRSLVTRQLRQKKEERKILSDELRSLHQQWEQFNTTPDSRQEIQDALGHLENQDYAKKERTILKKLINLNGGKLRIPQRTTNYINLTDYQPDEDEESLLQMGLNYHCASKIDPKKKRLEVEVLLDSIFSLEKKGEVRLSDSLQPLLLAEALTDRSNHNKSIIDRHMRDAAKRLKQKKDVSVRRADKTAALVLIPTAEYNNKLDAILNNDTKFRRITRNPIDEIKRETNKIIERVNASSSAVHLPPISGDFDPGYLYGTVKTHKNGNPLRPIISQIPTPTYALAKKLNNILTPYIPSDFSIKSSIDFLDIVRRTPTDGIIASMDVESLFTNVPVDETISLILNKVYHDDSTPKLDIPEAALKALLEICTKRAPFITHRGHMYTQIDGVAMGSPLGVLFANFYMGIVEERVFSSSPPPPTYCRYVDDTFVAVRDETDIQDLIARFQQHSVLRFTSECSVDGKLPFLDVLVSSNNEGITTSVYRKSTDEGHCLNGNSECPQRYKSSVIDTYIRRALTHCSTWHLTNEELKKTTQMLVNNGYSNEEVEKRIRKNINKWYMENHEETPENNNIKLFYRGYYHKNYKEDEKALRKIINENITPTRENSKINLNIYYKSKKTSQLLLKNNPAPQPSDLKKRNVVYQFKCPEVGCSHSYIGLTTTRLSKRISCHLQEGNIYKHFNHQHSRRPTREEVVNSTEVIDTAPDHKRLRYLEAIYILRDKPSLNITQENFLLPTTQHRRN